MKITIVGAGNIGTQFAVHCAQKNEVTIYTTKPKIISTSIKIVDENNNQILKGDNIVATNDLYKAFNDTDLIFITYPAFAMEDIAEKIYPFVKKGLLIGIIPGNGGGECAFKKCLEKGAIIFGLQRVPSVARLVQKGKIVKAIGYRKELFLGSLPKKEAKNISKIITDIFNINCIPLPNYLNLTLTPSNPILHTTRLKTIFKDYNGKKQYNSLPLFYEDWDDESSELLFKCDDEVQTICKKLKMFDLSQVKSLKEHYESNTPNELTNKIKSINGFKGLKTPAILINNKYIPDIKSRYFTADFSYGLSILIQIGNLLNLDIPNMTDVMDWYKKIAKDENFFSFEKYGITNINELISFYNQ